MFDGWDKTKPTPDPGIQEFPAGPGRSLVVYGSGDFGIEVDPFLFFGQVAADAAARAERGQAIVSMVGLPLRHAGVGFGREGSGFETKSCVAVLYATGGDEAGVAAAPAGPADDPPQPQQPPWT
jgi:hypothetical protein